MTPADIIKRPIALTEKAALGGRSTGCAVAHVCISPTWYCASRMLSVAKYVPGWA